MSIKTIKKTKKESVKEAAAEVIVAEEIPTSKKTSPTPRKRKPKTVATIPTSCSPPSPPSPMAFSGGGVGKTVASVSLPPQVSIPLVQTPSPQKIPFDVINTILERDKIANEIKSILVDFDLHRDENMFKRGIYIYGPPGSGKTDFIMQILQEINYDVIKYDTGDVRNKSLIDTITKHNMSDRNVLSVLRGQPRKLSIVMDEIDGMNNGDKGGITALIKLIRQKKTKKQKLEDVTMNPIICIGNYHTDKKIRELMKVCNIFELKKPTNEQIMKLISLISPEMDTALSEKIALYSQGDLRKMNLYCRYYLADKNIFQNEAFFQMKFYNDNTKRITESLMNTPYTISDHNVLMNETDRTIVALLWHENIIDAISKKTMDSQYQFYRRVLDNICFSDYIDRLTFQNQIWQFNEMTSLVKTFHNNKIYHDTFPENRGKFHPTPDVRFTKVLTKYSTEYNNILFIYNLCQQLDMPQKDMLAFFQELRFKYQDINVIIENIIDKYELNKLYIKRLYRYLDKNAKKDAAIEEEELFDADEDDSIEED